ncbi:helix-turn-helix transcriptional regulator [Phytohabitans kaempferiae]|uniref:LuxR C-terminal-related transcriptional regulator n=1 Tax=Phytohabitans kaempferiae TaxID=1620943 RepID=A0ABV6LXF5_9ACTN
MRAIQTQTRDRVLRVAESAPDLTWLLRQSAAALGRAVPVEGWCGFTLDPGTLVKTTGVHATQLSPALLGRLFELEYHPGDANLFADLAREQRPTAVLTDRGASSRYHEVLRPSGYGQELRLVLLDRGTAWGGFVFLREPGSPPFTPAESRFVATLGRHLARGVRRILLRAAPPETGQAAHPGLLLLDERYRVASSTAGTDALLADLAGGSAHPRGLPTAVYAVAAKAIPGQAPASVRVPTRHGGWATLYGWRLADPSRIAISIERSRPEAVTTLALDGYGLSARERQIVELLLAGRSTREVATDLYLSPHTVRDHIKTIFAKTGVRSRPELTAALRPVG